MRRLATLFASLTIVGGLGACCCPCGGFPRGGGGPVNINIPPVVVNPDGNVKRPVDDANVTAIKARGGTVELQIQTRAVLGVDLAFKNLNDDDVRVLLAPFRQLRKLRLSQNPGITGVGFRELGILQQLELIDVSRCSIDDDGVKAIANFRQLKELNLSNTKVTDNGMQDVAKLRQLQELRVGPDITDVAVNALKDHDRLQVLVLANPRSLTADCIPALVSMPSLREVQLNGVSQQTKTRIRTGVPGRITVR
jgi:Leucine Rich repeat